MKHISRYYKRLHVRNIKIAVLAVFVSIFFLPVYVGFQHTGDNMFTVLLNGVEVGIVGSPAEAQQYALEARKQIARDSKELVLVECNIETVGKEVLFGQTDPKEEVVSHMAMVLADDVRQTMNRCYVVKINDLMLNLSTKDEVLTVLQAALDKYNTEKQGSYMAELFLDPARELPVLTAHAISNEEIKEQARQAVLELGEIAGLQKGSIFVVGCSTSEVCGDKIGTNSNVEVADALVQGVYEVLREKGIYLAAQCCEHLNRALVVEREAVPFSEIVNVIPQPKAGGSFATKTYEILKNPVVVEEIRADAGIDIGATLIGMHIKKVAVPVRLQNHTIGSAQVTAARSRAKFIGGERAVYDAQMM